MNDEPIAITVITGFLGAGKSTLLQHWLHEFPAENVAVIVNERGDLGMDGELLAGHVARLKEITGGCVCCSSQAELAQALAALRDEAPRPGRILIETSGAASPSGVLAVVASERLKPFFRIDGVVTVVNALRLEQTLQFDLAVEQLGFADIVVLTHLDQAVPPSSPVDVEAVTARLRRHAPAATVDASQTPTSRPRLLHLLPQRGEALHLTATGEPSHAAIDTVSLQCDGDLDEEAFGDWMEDRLGALEARIVRIKGIVAMAAVNCRVLIQGVSQSVDVQLGRPWGEAPRCSRMVVIGLGLDADELQDGFLQCRAHHQANQPLVDPAPPSL